MLLDHDLEGQSAFLEAGWRETGWDQDLHLEFIQAKISGVRLVWELGVPHHPARQSTAAVPGRRWANPTCVLQRHS